MDLNSNDEINLEEQLRQLSFDQAVDCKSVICKTPKKTNSNVSSFIKNSPKTNSSELKTQTSSPLKKIAEPFKKIRSWIKKYRKG